MNFFDKLNDLIDNTEGSVINLLTAIAPWAAPTIPAYMTFIHAEGALGFPGPIAFLAAFVVEVLGLSTVSTGIKFWKYNQKNSRASEYRKAPLLIVVGTFVYYMVSIILSNVILDATLAFRPDLNAVAVIAVKAVFTSLTLPAGLIIAVRQQHRDILEEISDSKIQNKSNLPRVPVSNGTGNGTGTRNTKNKDMVFTFLDKIYAEENRVASFSEVRDTLHIPQGSASRNRIEWMNNKGLN